MSMFSEYSYRGFAMRYYTPDLILISFWENLNFQFGTPDDLLVLVLLLHTELAMVVSEARLSSVTKNSLWTHWTVSSGRPSSPARTRTRATSSYGPTASRRREEIAMWHSGLCTYERARARLGPRAPRARRDVIWYDMIWYDVAARAWESLTTLQWHWHGVATWKIWPPTCPRSLA